MTLQSKQSTAEVTAVDRRKRPRYRLSTPVSIRRCNGAVIPGMSLEVSESGMSISTSETLNGGERVEIGLAIELKLPAVVRHTQGKVYGLEFVNLAEEHLENVKKICSNLPRFRTGSLPI